MINFLPFVGSQYTARQLFNKRIMVLGDSHYCANPQDAVPTLTQDIINYYLNPYSENEGWMQTYRKFERSLVNHETSPDESISIWNSLLFYNFLQVPLSGPRVAGTSADYHNAAPAFFEVLDKYSPEVIIVWSKRLWDNLPNQRWSPAPDIIYDNYHISNGFYSLSNGSQAKAFYIYHPSTGYSWDWWYQAIKRAITE
ncbi:MAG: hypothetical protein Q4C30_07035 [Bacteroidia bacterium]|nr:hypothetical protein [Bacteroidia bacterium]